MSYTGYTEGTFSAQINNFRNRNASLEQQITQLTEALQARDNEIRYLHNLLQQQNTLLQKQNTDSSIIQSEEQTVDTSSVKKQNKKQTHTQNE